MILPLAQDQFERWFMLESVRLLLKSLKMFMVTHTVKNIPGLSISWSFRRQIDNFFGLYFFPNLCFCFSNEYNLFC